MSIIPKGGSGANGLEGTRAGAIGFKVIHIRPDAGNSGNPSNRSHSGTPFYNGPAGSVGTLNIRIFDSANTLVAAGTENIIFPAEVGRQVNISNITTRDDNSVNSNTNFQRVRKNTKLTEISLPRAVSFLMAARTHRNFYYLIISAVMILISFQQEQHYQKKMALHLFLFQVLQI